MRDPLPGREGPGRRGLVGSLRRVIGRATALTLLAATASHCGGGGSAVTSPSTVATPRNTASRVAAVPDPPFSLSLTPSPIVPLVIGDERRYDWTLTVTGRDAPGVLVSVRHDWYDWSGKLVSTNGPTAVDRAVAPGQTLSLAGFVTNPDWSVRLVQARFGVSFLDPSGWADAMELVVAVDDTVPRPGQPVDVPQLLLPPEGAVVDNGCTNRTESIEWDFTWTSVPGAEDYHLYVIGPTATIPVANTLVLGTSHHLSSPGSYVVDANLLGWHWKVGARVGGRYHYSADRLFDVERPDSDCP